MKTETTIRRVQPGDEETLAYILTESWKAAFSDILDSDTLTRCTGIEAAIGMFRKLLEEGTGNGYLLFVNGKPHCTAWWDAARDPEFAGKAELISIYSLPDEWRKGYGTIMLERVFSDIRAALSRTESCRFFLPAADSAAGIIPAIHRIKNLLSFENHSCIRRKSVIY